MDDATIKGLTEGTAAENISKTMSYLVFFKTLTQIITNFNAASAGFSFESFLAVLLGGKQIATGNQTIADLTDRNGTPISLKLYKEGKLEVGGSFTDLMVDLENLGEMQYICTTKDLTGEGLDQEGRLTFYRFPKEYFVTQDFPRFQRREHGRCAAKEDVLTEPRGVRSRILRPSSYGIRSKRSSYSGRGT